MERLELAINIFATMMSSPLYVKENHLDNIKEAFNLAELILEEERTRTNTDDIEGNIRNTILQIGDTEHVNSLESINTMLPGETEEEYMERVMQHNQPEETNDELTVERIHSALYKPTSSEDAPFK
jgi:hypothetical protein